MSKSPFNDITIHRKRTTFTGKISPSGRVSCGYSIDREAHKQRKERELQDSLDKLCTYHYESLEGTYHIDLPLQVAIGLKLPNAAEQMVEGMKTIPIILHSPPRLLKWSQNERQRLLEELRWFSLGLTDPDTGDELVCSMAEAIRLKLPGAAEQQTSSEVGLTKVANLDKTFKNGLKGLTSLGRQRIQEGCFLLQQWYGARNLNFSTFTLPSLSLPVSLCLSRNWGKLVNRLLRRMRRASESRGYSNWHCVGVTEIQSHRMEAYGGIPYHLHLVHPGYGYTGGGTSRRRKNSKKTYIFKIRELLQYWKAAILEVLAECYDLGIPPEDHIAIDNYSSGFDTKRVKKNAAGYLCKYLSKGSAIDSVIEEYGEEYVVGQWYTCSRPLSRAIDDRYIELPPDIAWQLHLNPSEIIPSEDILWWHSIEITLDDVVWIVGTCFGITEHGRLAILDMIGYL